MDERGGSAVGLVAAGAGEASPRDRLEIPVSRICRPDPDDRAHRDPAIARRRARRAGRTAGMGR